ncbi:MAG TPA: OmpA family protein [bacterium]
MKNLPLVAVFFGMAVLLSCAGAKVKPDAQNVIQSIEVAEVENDTIITVTGADNINYTFFTTEEPPKLSIDLVHASLDELKSFYSIENGTITQIEIIKGVEGDTAVSRLDVNMSNLMNFSVSAEGNTLTISVSKVEKYKNPEQPPETEEAIGSIQAAPETPLAPIPETLDEGLSPETVPLQEGAVSEPLEEASSETAGKSIESVIEGTDNLSEAPAPEVPSLQSNLEAEVIIPPPPPLANVENKMVKIEGNRLVTPEPLTFDSNNAKLPDRYLPILEEVKNILMGNAEMRIRIVGYTDDSGSSDFNKALSEYRAIWAKLLLENQGIAPDRIEILGLGDENPVVDNAASEERKKNRRIEFVIISR